MEGQSAHFVRKGVLIMLPLRKEIQDYSRSCEHLISAAVSRDVTPFSPDEIQWIAYYATEVTSLVDRVARMPVSDGSHERQVIREYARASGALLKLEDLSEDERRRITLIDDIAKKVIYPNAGQVGSGWKSTL